MPTPPLMIAAWKVPSPSQKHCNFAGVSIVGDNKQQKAVSHEVDSRSYGLTQYVYDALGRTCVVVRPDGAVVTSCPSAAPAGDVFTTYAGNCTTVTDEAGKTSRILR